MIDKLASVPLPAVAGLIMLSAVLLDKTILALVPLAALLGLLACKALRSA